MLWMNKYSRFKRIIAIVLCVPLIFSLAACSGGTSSTENKELCHSCSKEVSSENSFCPHCGVALNIVCSSCNKQLPIDSKFCSYCGADVLQGDSSDNEGDTSDVPNGEATTLPIACNHSWVEAKCTTPKTCEKCGLTEGEPIGHHWWYEDGTRICIECSMEEDVEASTAPTSCNHNWYHATCTTPQTCEKCGATEGEPNGHWWYEATCTEGRMCTVCLAEDPDSEPLGHLYIGEKCARCGEIDPDYAEPTVKATATTVSLSDEPKTIYITLLNWYSVEYEIENSNIVDGVWGEWDGDIIPLTLIPVSSGETTINVYPQDYEELGIAIEVSVNMPTSADLSSLTVDGLGKEYTYFKTTGTIDSADYEITTNYDGSIDITVNVVMEVLEIEENVSAADAHLFIQYELIDETGICVQTGTILESVSRKNQKYSETIWFYGLPVGNYTLNFLYSTEGNSDFLTYGQVFGQLTYQYNKTIGTRGDNGATVMLIPIDDEVKTFDNEDAAMLLTGTYDSGIIVTKCDGYGNFDFGNVVPTGDYILLGVSKNTTSGGRFNDEAAWKEELNNIVGGLLSESDMETLCTFIGYQSWCWDRITLKDGDSLKITCDFGYTFI